MLDILRTVLLARPLDMKQRDSRLRMA